MRYSNPAAGQVVFRVDPKLIARNRLGHKVSLIFGSVALGAYFIVPPFLVYVVGAYIALSPGISMDPPKWALGGVAVVAIVAFVMFIEYRRLMRVNAVEVTGSGLYPPFKPRKRLSKEDWFIPYRDIASMEPVAEKKGLIPAYDITLGDGLRFQLNALDLLAYVGEGEVRRYMEMLRVIREEILKPENRARAARGEDIVIPREKFSVTPAG